MLPCGKTARLQHAIVSSSRDFVIIVFMICNLYIYSKLGSNLLPHMQKNDL
jgi:hypothetical protein